MTFTALWYKTGLPKSVIDSFLEESKDLKVETSLLKGAQLKLSSRNSKVCWISSSHWMAGFCYHYILQANKENYGYDIHGFDNKFLQYTSYSEGEYYNWHNDLINEKDLSSVRKLSFTVQLSDPEEYSGGELQFLDDSDNLFFAPKEKGTIVIFDSRLKHRVMKVRSGCRKSLVGWVEGPRWK